MRNKLNLTLIGVGSILLGVGIGIRIAKFVMGVK